MPSNQTPNYSLSQWERTDKVLMDDFNEDNAKIDAALGALAAASAKHGNCQVGIFDVKEPPKSGIVVHFPAKPIAIFLVNGSFIGVWIKGMEYGSNVCFSSVHSAAFGSFTLNWNGSTLTIPKLINDTDTYTIPYTLLALYAQDEEN